MNLYNSDIQTISENYNHLQKTGKIKTQKIILIILICALIISAVLYVLSSIGVLNEYEYFFYSLILPGVVLLTLILVSLLYISSKPLFNYVYPEAIRDINMNDDMNIQIQSFVKDARFIKKGGLFPVGSGRLFRFKLSYVNEDGVEVNIYDAYIYTQANKSRIVYIDGLYYVFKVTPEMTFQIRRKGRHRFKNMEIKKLSGRTDLKAYLEQGNDRIPDKYYALYDKLSVDRMQVYISGVDDAYHIGLHGYHKYRKIKELDKLEYDGLKDYIRRLIKIAEKIYETIKK